MNTNTNSNSGTADDLRSSLQKITTTRDCKMMMTIRMMTMAIIMRTADDRSSFLQKITARGCKREKEIKITVTRGKINFLFNIGDSLFSGKDIS